jgi:hypothetical protein
MRLSLADPPSLFTILFVGESWKLTQAYRPRTARGDRSHLGSPGALRGC